MNRNRLRLSLQENAPAAEIGQLPLQGVDLRFTYRQLQFHAVGGELLFHDQAAEFGHPQLGQCQFAEAAGTAQRDPADQRQSFGILQALVGAAAIGTGQAAGAQLDAAVPANDQYRDLVVVLGLDGRQDRPARGTAGFAVVTAAVLVGELPGLAVVGGIEVAVLLDKGLGFGDAGDRGGEGDEAAFANFLSVFAKAGKGKRHTGFGFSS